ncbi:MAG: ATP-dependent helicase, partial [Miltoncostaeaceae bacterium]
MLDGLTTAQRDAVAHSGGPMVVVAGAGAGKTTVLSRRLAWLVAEGTAPASVLALTFTQKAAAELRGRAEDLLGRSHETLRVMTFHAWARDLVRTHGVEAGALAPRDIIGEEERALMLLDRLAELDLRHYDMRGDPATVVERLIARIDRFRDNLLDAEQALSWARDRVANAGRPADRARAERELEFATAFAAHDRWLEEAGLEDFGGSLARAIDLLRSEPSAHGAACEATRHVLVDEFQDTNYAQAQLLYEVSDRAESVVVVGDDDQGIYRFRGASTKNMADFRNRYPACAEARLVVNFRSHQRILDASGAVVAPLPDRDPKELRAAEGSA